MTERARAFPLVLAAPSGAGKTTLARAIVERDPAAVFSLSATTRPPRPDERDGDHYRFVDDREFDRLEREGALLESARVHAWRYGTLRASVEDALLRGRTVVLDIDVQGARRIRTLFADAVLVFVLPPSADELERRLQARGSEGLAEKRLRMQTALNELRAVREFDYLIVNEDLETAIGVLESILAAERHRPSHAEHMTERAGELIDRLRDMIERRTANEGFHTG